MAFTDINSEDRLVQETFANYLRETLGWESVYAWNQETFGPASNLGRDRERHAVLKRDLREALARLNPQLPEAARKDAFDKLTQAEYTRSFLQHNQLFYKYIRDGVPVEWRDDQGQMRFDHAHVIDFSATPADIVAPIGTLVASLVEGLEAVEKHLRGVSFEPESAPWGSGPAMRGRRRMSRSRS